MEQKYIKDNDGNIVLPITSVTAVRDSEGQTLAAKIEELELKSDGNNNSIKTEESRANNAESSLHSSVVSTNNALNTERSERTAAEAQLRAELNAKQYEAEAIELDAVPTKDSTKMVNSGAVYTALQNMTYDVSVKHPASGVDSGNTYTLSGALAVIPTADRKAGMSIKFIDSEKNEYVQYRFLGATTDGFTTVANWQGVDDEPTAESGNLVTSGGVYKDGLKKLAQVGYYPATISGSEVLVSVADAPDYVLTKGGDIHLMMLSAGTTASTLKIGNADAKELWYNGAAVSTQNTWEVGEIISAFYDGIRFMASNSQCGAGIQKPSIKFDESENILNIVDSEGKLLVYWDKDGNMLFKRSVPISKYWIKGRYYDVNGNLTYLGGDAYFGTCEIDVTQYNGKTIFVNSICSSNAYNLFVDNQGNVLDSWQQDSIITKEIPQNANKLLLSNAFDSPTGTLNDNPSAYFNDALSYILENFGSLSQKEVGIFAKDDKSGNLLSVCDTNGNILAYWDKDGKFHARISNVDQEDFKMYLPETINSYVGDTLQLFKYPMTLLGDYSNYGINLSVNTSDNNIRKYGKILRRYFEFIPLATGTYNIDANVLDTRQMTVLVEKTMTINVLTPTNPSSVKNILCIGDSETFGVINNSGITAADGSKGSTHFSWVNEIKERMTTLRTATQTLPAGLGLSNIHFIGTQNATDGRHEGYGGWDGGDFMKSKSPFYINGAIDFNAYLAKDDVYDDTTNKGVDIIYITLGANTTKTITVSDRKLILSADEHKTQIISLLNVINTQLRTDSSKAYYNPNLKVVLLSYVFSWIDGYGYHPYGSGKYSDNCWTSQNYIACFNANNEIAAMDEYKDWVDSVLIAPQVDSEYAYCYINKQKNVYMADTEINHLEAVHPNELGYRMFGAAVMRDLLGRI